MISSGLIYEWPNFQKLSKCIKRAKHVNSFSNSAPWWSKFEKKPIWYKFDKKFEMSQIRNKYIFSCELCYNTIISLPFGQKPPKPKTPQTKTSQDKKTPDKTSQSKTFVFHFLKIFMVSQVHNLRIVQRLPV